MQRARRKRVDSKHQKINDGGASKATRKKSVKQEQVRMVREVNEYILSGKQSRENILSTSGTLGFF